MTVSINTLADLKRVMREPGVTITGLDHFGIGDKANDQAAFGPTFVKAFLSERRVTKVQGNDFAVAPLADSPRADWWWIGFDKAAHWTFDGSDVIVKHVRGDARKRCVYRVAL